MRLRYGPALLAALLLAACGDAPPPTAAPAADAPRLDAASAAAPGRSPHACFVSTATHGTQPWAYSYRRLRLRLPAATHSPAGETMEYRYRLRDAESGEIEQVVNCRLPRTWEAVEWLERRLKVPPGHRLRPWREDRAREDTEGEAVLMGCVTDGHCELPGLVAVVEPTNPEPEPVPDLCGINGCDYGGDSGGGGDATTAPGDSGSGDPCAECSPDAPILTCVTGIQRGATLTCTISDGTNPVSGSGWTWKSSQGHTVQELGTRSSWSGKVVLGGLVSATVGEGTAARTLQTSFAVNPRPWRWDSGDWSYSQGTAHICNNSIPAPGQLLGWNIVAGNTLCTGSANLRIQPDPTQATQPQGFNVDRVDSGMNAGLYYVSTADFEMRRASNLNPQILSGGTAMPLSGYQATKCGPAANFYRFNRCMGVNVDQLIAAAWGHEGFGYNGGSGHESIARREAPKQEIDPEWGIEHFVSRQGEIQADFKGRVMTELSNRARDLTYRAGDKSGNVRGNWSGTLYMWDGASGQYLGYTQSF